MKEIKSFSFAIKGIVSAIRDESHFRFHLVASFYVFFFGILFRLNTLFWCILTLNIALVLAAELFNTAIENLCDFSTREYNLTIKLIKDISAGGVLVTAVSAVITGIFIFGDIEKIKSIADFYIHSPLATGELLFTLVASVLFVTKFPFLKRLFSM